VILRVPDCRPAKRMKLPLAEVRQVCRLVHDSEGIEGIGRRTTPVRKKAA
jgi:hypothetical protein